MLELTLVAEPFGSEEQGIVAGNEDSHIPSVSKSNIPSHLWQRYIRGFRESHNFSVSAGYTVGDWQIHRFATLRNRRFKGKGTFNKFQYSFHLPLYGPFGYLLGSSLGYQFESPEQFERFRPAPSYNFPGVLVGLVVNSSVRWRVSLAFDVHLSRLEGLKDEVDELSESAGAARDTDIDVTMRTYDLILASDYFYTLNWALRLEWHLRRNEYIQPNLDIKRDMPLDAEFAKVDHWYGLGFVYHFL
jgi:hypothetical protein